MRELYDLLANAVAVIREDAGLREAFNKILGEGHADQRVPLLLREMEGLGAPAKIIKLVGMLSDDRIASIFYNEINR
jgi:hypothetical protein